jgi:hypothetical protein
VERSQAVIVAQNNDVDQYRLKHTVVVIVFLGFGVVPLGYEFDASSLLIVIQSRTVVRTTSLTILLSVIRFFRYIK